MIVLLGGFVLLLAAGDFAAGCLIGRAIRGPEPWSPERAVLDALEDMWAAPVVSDRGRGRNLLQSPRSGMPDPYAAGLDAPASPLLYEQTATSTQLVRDASTREGEGPVAALSQGSAGRCTTSRSSSGDRAPAPPRAVPGVLSPQSTEPEAARTQAARTSRPSSA